MSAPAITLVALLLPGINGCGGGGGNGSDAQANLALTAALRSPYQSADVVLEWRAPLARADGVTELPVTEIAGYQICYVGSDGKIHLIPENPAELQGHTSFTIHDLKPDHYEFNIFTLDSDNRISAPSATVTLAIEQFPLL